MAEASRNLASAAVPPPPPKLLALTPAALLHRRRLDTPQGLPVLPRLPSFLLPALAVAATLTLRMTPRLERERLRLFPALVTPLTLHRLTLRMAPFRLPPSPAFSRIAPLGIVTSSPSLGISSRIPSLHGIAPRDVPPALPPPRSFAMRSHPGWIVLLISSFSWTKTRAWSVPATPASCSVSQPRFGPRNGGAKWYNRWPATASGSQSRRNLWTLLGHSLP